MFNKKLNSFLRDYFTLTSRERGGALTLASLIIIQMGVLLWMNFRPLSQMPEVKKHALLIKEFEASKRAGNSSENLTKKTETKNLFPFDPNTITDDQWQQLGMSEKQTAVIRNYLRKGGRFRKKEDVAKMFVISESQYKELEPFIQIENSTATIHPGKEIKKEKKPVLIELNTADTLQLATLPLIGPGRARMIFKYREALGGFHQTEQLLEVFTIDSTVVEALRSHLIIDQEKIRKLSLNTDSIRHPYLTRKQAHVIVAFRKQHGNFRGLEDVNKVTVLNDETIRKLAPYLVFE